MDPNVLGTASGWTGAGLLGLVLCWLFFKYLPAKDTQIKELVEYYNKNMETIVASYDKATDKRKEEHKEMLKSVLAHCQTETEGLSKLVETQMESLTTAIQSLTMVVGKMDDHLREVQSVKMTKKFISNSLQNPNTGIK